MERHYELTHNAAAKRYEFNIEGEKAFIEYLEKPGVVVLTHTRVPESLGGRGIGSELVLSTLEAIRDRKLQVVPMCSFVAQYIRRHPQWEQIVFQDREQ